MSSSIRVSVLIGSLRRASLTRRIAQALVARAPKSFECRIVEIGDLPLYNEDLDLGSPPEPWTRFRSEVEGAGAVLFVTPEYNRSIPGCLKNALDVGSRPEGKSVFTGKPAGVVSVTPYKLGAFGANHALRQTFVFLDMPVMQQPEAYIGGAGDVVNDDGAVTDPAAAKLLQGFMSSFARFAATIRAGKDDGEDAASRLRALIEERRKVAQDYVNGNAETLAAIVTKEDPATFFHPKGNLVQGARAVEARYANDAKAFAPGGTTQLEIVQSGASGRLAFWTGYQRAEARIGDGKRVPMTLRITEVFRLEDGAFRLVHRHADMDRTEKPPT
jgi:NAD(P)H-dependent FMN reductase/ketosteroid isomerase-like protein